MNCREAREYLFAFLDSELDAAISIELQRHLDRCPACAREIEIEHEVGAALGRACASAGDDAAADVAMSRAAHSIQVDHAHDRFRRRGRGYLLGAAAALLVAVSGWLFIRPGAGGESNSFVQWLTSDYEHFLVDGREVELASVDGDEVSAWLRRRTGLDVRLPDIPAASGRLIGGRKCKRAGAPAAFAAYDLSGDTACLVILQTQESDVSGMESIAHGSHTHWVARRPNRNIVACRRGELLYAAIGPQDEPTLLQLMTGETHEGN